VVLNGSLSVTDKLDVKNALTVHGSLTIGTGDSAIDVGLTLEGVKSTSESNTINLNSF
jgi:hypothetical protein